MSWCKYQTKIIGPKTKTRLVWKFFKSTQEQENHNNPSSRSRGPGWYVQKLIVHTPYQTNNGWNQTLVYKVDWIIAIKNNRNVAPKSYRHEVVGNNYYRLDSRNDPYKNSNSFRKWNPIKKNFISTKNKNRKIESFLFLNEFITCERYWISS
jgi:hypothetical protein